MTSIMVLFREIEQLLAVNQLLPDLTILEDFSLMTGCDNEPVRMWAPL